MMSKKIFLRFFIISLLIFLIVYGIFAISTIKKIQKIKSLPPIQYIQGETWYKNAKIVGHAGGGIEGRDYTNSKESILHTLSHGVNVIEMDFDYTSDGYLVCYHLPQNINRDVTEEITLKEFKQQKIQGKYTPIIAEDIFYYIEQYPELYITVDTKHEELTTVVEDLVSICPNPELLNRLIIQCYYPGEKEKILNIYEFPEENLIYTSYKHTKNAYDVLEICLEENYQVALMKYTHLTPETIQLFKEKNIYLYAYTVNSVSVADKLKEQGIHGIYTDFLF